MTTFVCSLRPAVVVLWTSTACFTLGADTWEQVLKGMRSGREVWRSGSAEISGVHRWKRLPGVPDGECRVYMFVSFDKSQDGIRCERRETLSPLLQGQPPGAILDWKYCANSEYSALYSSHNPQVYLGAKGKVPSHSLLHPIDWRGAGLHLWAAYSTGKSLSSHWDAYERRPPDELKTDADGLICVTWNYRDRRRRLWVKPEGMVAVRHISEGKTPRGDWRMPHFESTVKWESSNSVWVPTEFTIAEIRQENTAEGSVLREQQSYELTLKWRDINRTIDSEVFGYRDMDIPKGTLVGDWRTIENQGQVVDRF